MLRFSVLWFSVLWFSSSPVLTMRALILISMLLLTACAAPPPLPPTAAPAETPTGVVQAPSTTPRPTRLPPTPAPASPTPEPVTFTLWVAENEAGLAFASALAAEFSAAGDVPVEVVAREPDTLRLSLAAAALAGDPPPDLIWADQNALVGLVAEAQLQPLAVEADVLPALRVAVTYADGMYGAPIAADGALLLYYNRALVAVPPATSDALIVQSRAAVTAATAGLVMFWDDVRWLLPWLYAFGGNLAGGDGAQPTLDTPEMAQTLTLMRELYSAAPREGDAYVPGQRRFAAGAAAFAVDGDWALPRYRAVSDTLDLGIAPLPRVPATGRAAAPVLNGSYLMLHRDVAAADVAAAEAFSAFVQSASIQERIAAELGRLPAVRAALTSPAVREDPALAAAAALAEDAPAIAPTVVTRCALFGISVWLPSTLDGRTDLAEAPLRMQREAEACVTNT